jgi:hypothetical protein
LYPENPILLVDVIPPGIFPIRLYYFYGSLLTDILCHALEPATSARNTGTLSCIARRLLSCREWRETNQVIPGSFCKAPEHHLIRVLLIVQAYQSQDQALKAVRTAGEGFLPA